MKSVKESRSALPWFVVAWAVMLLAVGAAFAQQPTHKRIVPPSKSASTSTTPATSQPSQTTYKGVWEPVNYPDDVHLSSVYFVNEKTGWAAGKGQGGFILHTADGGEHWEVQLGDPGSSDDAFEKLYFLDRTHGWAVQHGQKLVRTTDGTSWQDAGMFPNFVPLQKYAFTSLRDGFHLGGYYNTSQINVTHDGGRNWKQVFACEATLQIEGLTKRVACFLQDFHFPTARVGYAVGGGFNGGYSVVVKSEDGGNTWNLIFATTEMETADAVFFTDETHGVIRLRDGRIFATADGGQSWNGIPASARGALKFADPEVGVSCKERGCSFTSDGGQRWISRDFRFPASVEDFSIPRRDCIYAVGEHGMVYRYRVVPTSFTAKGGFDAPAMPAYGGAIAADLDRIKAKISVLQAKLTAAAGGQGPSEQTADNAQSTSSPANGSFGSDASGAAAIAGTSFQQEGGFTQDTGLSATAFNTPISQPVQDCCAAQIQSLQTDMVSFGQQVPPFSGKFRNLNLLFVGMNMFADLVNKAHAVRDSFLALKKAPNLQAAVAALQDLSGRLQVTTQAVTSGFQDLTVSNTPTAGTGMASAVVGNALTNPAPAQPETPSGTQVPNQQSPGVSGVVDSAVQKVKQKLKIKKFPF